MADANTPMQGANPQRGNQAVAATPDQLATAVKPLLNLYLPDNKKKFRAYAKERGEAEMERLKPDNAKAIENAEKEAAEALTKLTNAIEKTQLKGGSAAQMKTQKDALIAALKTPGPDILRDIVTIDILHDKSKGWFLNTMADHIANIGKATDPKKKETETAALKKKIAKKFKYLSPGDVEAVAGNLVNQAPAQAAEIEKANPVQGAVSKAVGGVVDEVTNPATYMPPVAQRAFTAGKRLIGR